MPRSVGDSPSYRGEGGDNEIEPDYEHPCEDCDEDCESNGCDCTCHSPENIPPEDREDDE